MKNKTMLKDLIVFEFENKKWLIKPTIDDKRQFEINSRCSYANEILGRLIEDINHLESFKGKYLHKNLSNYHYISSEEWNELDDFHKKMNPISGDSYLITDEIVENYIMDALNYKISYYSEELISKSLHQSSTNKLSNLENEWIIDEKQTMIRMFKRFLE